MSGVESGKIILGEADYRALKLDISQLQYKVCQLEDKIRSIEGNNLQPPSLDTRNTQTSFSPRKRPKFHSTKNVDLVHTPKLSTDARHNGRVRYRVCKVCSILHVVKNTNLKKPHATRFYCDECEVPNCSTVQIDDEGHHSNYSTSEVAEPPQDRVRIYLCNRPRGDGETRTCFMIWHQVWDCGRNIPENIRPKESKFAVRFRKSGSSEDSERVRIDIHDDQIASMTKNGVLMKRQSKINDIQNEVSYTVAVANDKKNQK